MPSAVKLRDDFSAIQLRALAKRPKNAHRSRRLLSLAAVREGMDRGEAAKIAAWAARRCATVIASMRRVRTASSTIGRAARRCAFLPINSPTWLRLSRPVQTGRLTASCAGYLFGGICPARGVGTALALPFTDTEAMQLHLDEISRHVSDGAHAVLLLDRAGWHTTAKLDMPSNITPIFLVMGRPQASTMTLCGHHADGQSPALRPPFSSCRRAVRFGCRAIDRVNIAQLGAHQRRTAEATIRASLNDEIGCRRWSRDYKRRDNPAFGSPT